MSDFFAPIGDDITPEYAANIQALLERCATDWGSPDDNRKDLLPFGIEPFDVALYGMDSINGELVLVQGPEKQRKTTSVINILANYMTSPKPEEKPVTVIDALESGMQPGRYRDTIIANVVTRKLMEAGHRYKEFCPVCNNARCNELGITPEFLRYNYRTPVQTEAIEAGMAEIAKWPLRIYGANFKEGDTRNLDTSVKGDAILKSRWKRLIEEYGAKVFVIDHVQQYSFHDEPTDYEKQIRTISAVSDIVAQYNVVVLMLSQVSLTSQRDAASGVGKYYAAGGRKAAAEATSIFSVNYESGSGKMCMTLEDSRKASSFSVWIDLEDASGAFLPYKKPQRGPKAAIRPGTEEGMKHGRPAAK